MKPLYTISMPVSVGIWDDEEYTARVYADKIIVESPYVHWQNNSGSLAISKEAIRSASTIAAVIADLVDDCEPSAWALIGRALDDDHLMHANW